MSRVCELTGKRPMAGNNRSHAENKSRRVFRPNLQVVSLVSDALRRTVRLRISTQAIRMVSRRGLDETLARAAPGDLSDRCRRLRAEIKRADQPRATRPSN